MIKSSFCMFLAIAFSTISIPNLSAAAALELPTISPADVRLEGVPESATKHLKQAASAFQLLATVKSLRSMDAKEIKRLSSNIGKHNQEKLESIIPQEIQAQETVTTSCCLPFFKSCLSISGKALGKLAINLVLDLADGKLDGRGPTGDINYIEEVLGVVYQEIQAINTPKH